MEEALPRRLRSAVFGVLDLLQLPRLGLVFNGTAPRILLYHGVTSHGGEGIFNYRGKFVTTQAFKAHLEYLKNHFKIVPLGELITAIQNGTDTEQMLAITFDDGYVNNYSEAFPILREMGVPATFFITTDFVDKWIPLPVDIIEYAIGMTEHTELTIEMNGVQKVFTLSDSAARIRTDLAMRAHMKTLPAPEAEAFLEAIVHASGKDLRNRLKDTPYKPMDWDQIRDMARHGMTFAPHTVSHPILSRVSLEQTKNEIGDSTKLMRTHVETLPIFAYPNGGAGDFTDKTISILKDQGFTAALTTESCTIPPDVSLYKIPRYTMDGANDMHRARLIISGIYQWFV